MSRSALLFDLDGTLIESDPLHHRAFKALLAGSGRTMDLEEYRRAIIGKSNAAIMAYLFPDRPDEHAALADRKEAIYRAMLGGVAEPVAGLESLLDWAAEADIGTAVVTNAPRANVDAVLEAIGMARRFEAIVIGDECARPKPDPAPYRAAMEQLGVTPSGAVAFEDSPSGLRAARGSGAHVFGLATSLAPDALRAAGAHQAIADFHDPALWAHLQTLKARVA